MWHLCYSAHAAGSLLTLARSPNCHSQSVFKCSVRGTNAGPSNVNTTSLHERDLPEGLVRVATGLMARCDMSRRHREEEAGPRPLTSLLPVIFPLQVRIPAIGSSVSHAASPIIFLKLTGGAAQRAYCSLKGLKGLKGLGVYHDQKQQYLASSSNQLYSRQSGTMHTGKPALFMCLHAIAVFTMFTNSYQVFTSIML